MNGTQLKKVLYLVLLVVTLMGFVVSGNAEISESLPIWKALGIWTMVPPFVAITLAFLTKDVILSLALGAFSGTMMVAFTHSGFKLLEVIPAAFTNMINTIIGSMADKWNAGVLLQVLAIGGLVALVAKLGGTAAIANALSKKAKTARSSQFITWILGIFVFFDDYANALIVGPVMKPVTDKQRVSREKLAFIVDSTAAPIAGIALVSTWIGYELSLIKPELAALPVKTSAYQLFLDTIPYRFYNIFILAFIVVTILLLKEFGPMYKAEKRARTTGKVLADGATPLAVDVHMEVDSDAIKKASIWNAIVPIMTLIITALGGFYHNGYKVLESTDLVIVDASPFSIDAIRICYSNSDASLVLFMSAVIAGLVALVMGIFQKRFSIKDGIDTWVNGWKSMVITVIILLLAWSIGDVIKSQLDVDMYLATTLGDTLPAFSIPSLIFILGAIISFATGTSYGTMGILMPLAIPLTNTVSNGDMNLIVATTGAVLTGAIFGDHCSPISDTTILSSMGTSCDHIDHVRTQIWYSIVIAVLSVLFGFLPAGFGISPLITLPIGLVAVALLLIVFGKSVNSKHLDVAETE